MICIERYFIHLPQTAKPSLGLDQLHYGCLWMYLSDMSLRLVSTLNLKITDMAQR